MQPFLIVAGGNFQLPLIKAVRSRGFPVAVIDGDSNAQGFEFADYYKAMDISNEVKVIEYARKINPIAVASIVSEIAVTSVAAAASALNLPGISLDTARICTDKFNMRSIFSANGLPSPKFLSATTLEDAKLAALDIGLPVVIKPVDSSGSRGVMRVDRIEDIGNAYNAAKIISRTNGVIIESFLDGQEFTVETMTINEVTTVLGFSMKERVPFPHCVSVELLYFDFHDHPFGVEIVNLAIDAINSVGLQNGTAHTEIILTRDGPMLVELAARGGGYEIFTKILPEISGVNTVDVVIDLALGLKPSISATQKKCAILKFFNSEKRGIIKSIGGIQEAKNIKGVIALEIDQSILGGVFNGITRDGERLGYLIALDDEVSEVLSIADKVEKMINFDIANV